MKIVEFIQAKKKCKVIRNDNYQELSRTLKIQEESSHEEKQEYFVKLFTFWSKYNLDCSNQIDILKNAFPKSFMP